MASMLATLSNRLCALNKARHAYNAQLPVERVYLVALETQEQRLEREQNACDVLEALSDYKCDAGMSVENVPAVVDIKTLKRRFIAHKFSTGWAVVKSVPHTEELASQFGFKCNRIKPPRNWRKPEVEAEYKKKFEDDKFEFIIDNPSRRRRRVSCGIGY